MSVKVKELEITRLFLQAAKLKILLFKFENKPGCYIYFLGKHIIFLSNSGLGLLPTSDSNW